MISHSASPSPFQNSPCATALGRSGYTYEDLCYYTLDLSATLMTEAVTAFSKGELDSLRSKQGESEHECFKNAPDEVLEVVKQKLTDFTYKHYVD